MIWLEEKEKIIGYVPMLKKEYSEEQIKKMSEYSRYEGWSELSILVMKIQGIAYKKYSCSFPFRLEYGSDAKRLVDVSSNFDFECFLLPSDPIIIEHYIPQIFEVFKNLTFYKVEEYSSEQMSEKIETAKREIEQLISEKTLVAINYDIEYFLANAKRTTERLGELQKIFANKGYTLSSSLFENANPEILKQIYEKRETKITLEKTD